jgi:hypothetical protein
MTKMYGNGLNFLPLIENKDDFCSQVRALIIKILPLIAYKRDFVFSHPEHLSLLPLFVRFIILYLEYVSFKYFNTLYKNVIKL